MAKAKKTEAEEPLEKKLLKAADNLRKNMDAAEYKHLALGVIFLKYISDAFFLNQRSSANQIMALSQSIKIAFSILFIRCI